MATTATKTKKFSKKTTKRVISKKPTMKASIKKTTKPSIKKTASMPTWNPKNNVSFTSWFNQFSKAFNANASKWGFTTTQANAITKAFNAWGTSYTAWQSVQSTFATTTSKPAAKKSTTRKSAPKSTKSTKPATKPVAKKKSISKNGTSKSNGTKTVASSFVPKSWPHFNFDWSKTGRCTIWFGTSPSNSKTNHFPMNCKLVCLQFRINNGTWKTLTTTSKYNFTHVVSSPAPKNLQYRACYISMNGKKGPWHVSTPSYSKVAA